MRSIFLCGLMIAVATISATESVMAQLVQDLRKSEVKRLDFEPEDDSRNRVVPVRITRDFSQDAPQPVVLFSHGLGGARTNNTYLADHWAAYGLTAVFLQHAGSDELVWKNAVGRDRLSKLKEAASYVNLKARIDDVSFILDQLQRWNEDPDHPLHQRLDMEKIGLSGHSFGAVTTLNVAMTQLAVGGGEDRIDAFLPMSPQPGERAANRQVLSKIDSPVLCMTGTRDESPINPRVTAAIRREVYQALPEGDHYELVLDGAEHLAFSGGTDGVRRVRRDPDHHAVIQNTSTLFWNAYLRDDAAAKAILQSESIRDHAPMKPVDLWLWK